MYCTRSLRCGLRMDFEDRAVFMLCFVLRAEISVDDVIPAYVSQMRDSRKKTSGIVPTEQR